MSWPLVKLHDVCRPRQWKTIAASNLLEDGYPVYGANGKIGFYSEYTHEFPTLMITCRGATCGNVHISEPKSYINGNAMALDELDCQRIDIGYLYYYLLGRGFEDVISGSAQPQITGQGLTKVDVPLPPLPEQKRIAAILDKADAIRRKRQQAIQLAVDFLRAVFLDMFGDPVTNPKGLAVKSIGDLCDVGTGATPSRAVSEYYGGGVPWVKTTEVDGYVISETEESISNEGLRNSSCKLNPVGSIVLAMYGQGKTRGKVGVLGVEAATNQACAVIRPSSKVLMQYLYVYLQLSYEVLRSLGQGAGQPNLNLSMVKGFPVLMPSPDEQERFVRVVSSVDSFRKEVACGIRDCAELFDSISQKAFLGQI